MRKAQLSSHFKRTSFHKIVFYLPWFIWDSWYLNGQHLCFISSSKTHRNIHVWVEILFFFYLYQEFLWRNITYPDKSISPWRLSAKKINSINISQRCNKMDLLEKILNKFEKKKIWIIMIISRLTYFESRMWLCISPTSSSQKEKVSMFIRYHLAKRSWY